MASILVVGDIALPTQLRDVKSSDYDPDLGGRLPRSKKLKHQKKRGEHTIKKQ